MNGESSLFCFCRGKIEAARDFGMEDDGAASEGARSRYSTVSLSLEP